MSVVDLPAIHKLHQKHPLGGQLPVDAGDLEWERAGQEGLGGWGFWAGGPDISSHAFQEQEGRPRGTPAETGREGRRQAEKEGQAALPPQQGPRPPPGTLLLGDQKISPPRSSASSRHNEEHI